MGYPRYIKARHACVCKWCGTGFEARSPFARVCEKPACIREQQREPVRRRKAKQEMRGRIKKRVQTRRAISLRGESYEKLKAYCEEYGLTMSGWLEDQAKFFLAAAAAKAASDKPIRGGGTHLL